MEKPQKKRASAKSASRAERPETGFCGNRYIAFLRAINVGGRIVKMEHLRGLFDAMKFTNVETFIASGNVIFTAPSSDTSALEERIEYGLKQALGYEVATFLRTPEELTAIASYEPFGSRAAVPEGSALTVAFLKSAPNEFGWRKLMGVRTDMDEFETQKREVYWLSRIRLGESKFSGGLLEKSLGMAATMRNVTTVKKLAEKYAIPK